MKDLEHFVKAMYRMMGQYLEISCVGDAGDEQMFSPPFVFMYGMSFTLRQILIKTGTNSFYCVKNALISLVTQQLLKNVFQTFQNG